MELFDKFDKVKYSGYDLTNILRKMKPIKSILNRIDVYHDYIIRDGERADTIAYDYYGDSSFTWLVYACNNIYDPYYQWPLNNTQFYNYITRKYGDYYQTQVKIRGYINPNYDFTISEETLLSWPNDKRIGWVAQTIYEYEYARNEEKRKIKLISNKYLNQITNEVEELFK